MKTYLPILMLAAASALWAQSEELWISGGASVLANGNIGSPLPGGQPSDVHLGDGFRFGIRFDYNSTGHFGHELQYAYNRTDISDTTGTLAPANGSVSAATHQFGYNLLYYLRAEKGESKVQPFATAGFQIDDFVLPINPNDRDSSIRPGGNVGGGVKIRISPLFAFRFDVREYLTAKPNWDGMLFKQGGVLSQTEISAGFGVCF